VTFGVVVTELDTEAAAADSVSATCGPVSAFFEFNTSFGEGIEVAF
jgi:hypothetical protein